MLIGVVVLAMLGLLIGEVFVIVFLVRTVDRDKQWSEQYCATCGYDLTGLDDGAVCPECGSAKGEG